MSGNVGSFWWESVTRRGARDGTIFCLNCTLVSVDLCPRRASWIERDSQNVEPAVSIHHLSDVSRLESSACDLNLGQWEKNVNDFSCLFAVDQWILLQTRIFCYLEVSEDHSWSEIIEEYRNRDHWNTQLHNQNLHSMISISIGMNRFWLWRCLKWRSLKNSEMEIIPNISITQIYSNNL